MRKLLLLLVVVAAFATAVGPANAILYGTPDDNAHPYVGMLRFYDANGTYSHRCSGTALSSRLILTAGHCVFQMKTARWYQTETPPARPAADSQGVVGRPIVNPNYDDFATFPNTSDVGVVKLTGGSASAPYGQLSAPNALDSLYKHELFDIVGYGVQDVKPVVVANLQRMKAQAKLVNSTSGFSGGFNLHLSSDNGQAHQGGLCFGDSGGPVLLGSTVYAVNSFVVNGNCAGAGYSFRVDLPTINAWIRAQ